MTKLLLAVFPIILLLVGYAVPTWTAAIATLSSVLIICLLFVFYRLDYLHPIVSFLIPWAAILFLVDLDISSYKSSLSSTTYLLILSVLAFSLLSGVILLGKTVRSSRKNELPIVNTQVFWILAGVYFILVGLNIYNAGYIPLLQGIITGNTGYLDFGLKGIYGFFTAYANAFGVLSFYAYLTTGRNRYLFLYGVVLSFFILFVTRQNLVSVLIESIVVYSFIRGRIRLRYLFAVLAISLVLFSVIGDFRSGDIKLIAGIKPEYLWIPAPLIWLFSYTYFNILNLNNLVMFSNAPYYDGYSLAQLLPSFLRPVSDAEKYIQVSNFTVSSYMSPIYHDVGFVGTLVFTVIVTYVSVVYYKKAKYGESFFAISTYAVLYYCGVTSFFVNSWFYLPIIFQVFFYKIFELIAFRINKRKSLKNYVVEESVLRS